MIKHASSCDQVRFADDRYPCTCGTSQRKPTRVDELFNLAFSNDVKLTADDVRRPSHYQVFPDVESIEIIARSMTQAEFKGFCLGNVLKYRLRAGKKSELATMEKDLKKADFYKELFEQHKDKCYG